MKQGRPSWQVDQPPVAGSPPERRREFLDGTPAMGAGAVFGVRPRCAGHGRLPCEWHVFGGGGLSEGRNLDDPALPVREAGKPAHVGDPDPGAVRRRRDAVQAGLSAVWGAKRILLWVGPVGRPYSVDVVQAQTRSAQRLVAAQVDGALKVAHERRRWIVLAHQEQRCHPIRGGRACSSPAVRRRRGCTRAAVRPAWSSPLLDRHDR